MKEYEIQSRVQTFLGAHYARDILGEDTVPIVPDDPEELAQFKAALQDRLKQINRVGLPAASLASRDFAAAQQRRAILSTLESLKEKRDASG